MAKSFFVTGTDTDIGKTVVATIVARKLGAHYLKPLQCGNLEASDSDFARQWLPEGSVLAEIYRFAAPLSPHHAAAAENRSIDFEFLCSAVRTQLLAAQKHVVIEGAGGLLVPLDETHYVADLIAKTESETLLVARTGLGTLNHTLLSLEFLRQREIRIRGVILVGDENLANARSIETYGRTSILGRVPITSTFSTEWMAEAGRQLFLGDLQ